MDTRQFFERWITAMNELDFAAIETMVHPDFVAFYPQSGERFRGFASFRAQLENYPGGLTRDSADREHADIVETDERWAISPAFTVVPLTQPGRYTTITRIGYPDGTQWRTVTLVELRDNKVYRAESYFAPELPAPLATSIPSYGRQ